MKEQTDFEFEAILQYRTGSLSRKERRQTISFITEYTLNLNNKLNQVNTEHYFFNNYSKN